MRKRFVVVDVEQNQLANRLFVFASVIACAEEVGAKVVHFGFHDYADVFPSTRRDLLSRYPARSAGRLARPRLRRDAQRVARRLLRAAEGGKLRRFASPLMQVMQSGNETTLGKSAAERSRLTLDLDDPAIRQALADKPLTVFRGSLVRCPEAMWRQREPIRGYFRVDDAAAEKVRQLMTEVRSACEVVVGVHMRRTDYATFEGGRYFFSASQYARVMERVQHLFPDRRVGFVVCSDERVVADDFPGLAVTPGPGGVAEDLHALASCDALIGPPSTFSAWASFTGDVPLYFINDADAEPAWSSFKVVGAPDGETARVIAERGLR